MELLIKEFRDMLEHGEEYDLEKLASEFPNEHYVELLEKFIALEIEFYQTKGWTYNLARHEEFPELREFVLSAVRGSIKDGTVNDFEDDGSRHLHVASCEYGVTRWAFAEGGQGALYRATDTVLGDREVAVKVLKNAQSSRRFQLEAEITAKLDHPGIAPVYSYSFDGKNEDLSGALVDGRPFYAMRLINGLPLSDRIADFHNQPTNRKKHLRNNPEFVRLIESLVAACYTIAYAHSVGVLHCDVKPQNIMCGEFGATIVLDWGSAVSVPVRQNQRQAKRIACPEWTNDSLYTAAYASPEQKLGDRSLDERSDVYSMGATLYHIITGETPIDSNDFPVRKSQDKVGNVRLANPKCPRSLNSICIKALKFNPDDRYRGPEHLADDLSNWLRDEEIAAKPDNFLDKTFRFANQHKLATGLGLTALAMLCVGLLIFKAQHYNTQMLKLSLDSGFSLIEEICAPLENGELQNPKELETVAKLVHQHCDERIGENETARTIDELLSARLFHLRSITNYFYDTAVLDNIQVDVGGKEGFLQQAISDSEKAIDLFEQSFTGKNHSYLNERLATSNLFKARLLMSREQRQGENTSEDQNDLDTALDAIDVSEDYFEEVNFAGKTLGELFELRLKKAEASQLKGEVFLQQASEASDKTEANQKYIASATAFEDCIELLDGLHPETQTEIGKHLRANGRGYGYLGDVQLTQDQFGRALSSYAHSLKHRKEVVTRDSVISHEHLLQLARGYGNFVSTARNFGIIPTEDATKTDSGPADKEIAVTKLASLDGDQRKELIIETLNRYMFGEERALKLHRKLSTLDEKSSKRSLANSLNSVSELYFQAARQSQVTAEQNQLLDLSLKNAEEARGILEELYRSSNDRGTKNGLAYCNMLVLQNDRFRGKSNGELPSVILQYSPNFDEQNVTTDDIFIRCVAIKDSTMKNELALGIRKLAERGFKHQWRFEQHFDKEWIKLLKSEQDKLTSASLFESEIP